MFFKDSTSIHSNSSSCSSIWSKLSKFIHHKKRRHSIDNSSTSSSTLSNESEYSEDKHRKPLVPNADRSSTAMVIPPFSPTYCKANEFPYSNFYVKLPDGRWMIRYRDGNREILRTDIMEGYMI